MLIQVIRTNGRFDYVKDFMLEYLIDSHAIIRFRRRAGWVTLGEEPRRTNTQLRVEVGPERRAVNDRQMPSPQST
jgi:hypothetical protein